MTTSTGDQSPEPVGDSWMPPADPASDIGGSTPPAAGGYGATLEQLNRSSIDLSERVAALASAVKIVGELQEKQDEFEQAVILERRVQERRFLKLAGSLLMALLGVAIVVYVILLINVNGLIDANNKTAFKSCSTRNQAQLENADREQRLAELEKGKELRQLHAESAEKLRAQLSDCSKWQK